MISEITDKMTDEQIERSLVDLVTNVIDNAPAYISPTWIAGVAYERLAWEGIAPDAIETAAIMALKVLAITVLKEKQFEPIQGPNTASPHANKLEYWLWAREKTSQAGAGQS